MLTLNKEVYSTQDIAKLVNVAPRTVVKWIDTGKLPGYKIPGSTFRRVTKLALTRFLEKEMPHLFETETDVTVEDVWNSVTHSVAFDDCSILISPFKVNEVHEYSKCLQQLFSLAKANGIRLEEILQYAKRN